MSKKSQTIKEVVQIVVFLLVVGILALVFLIYPLNRTKAFFARPDIDEYNEDSIPTNDISAFADLPALIDSFRVDADGLTNLAGVYLRTAVEIDSSAPPDTTSQTLVARDPKGLVILLHNERSDRTDMIPTARALLEDGYTVCLYDQRASGFSTGAYHCDGEYEAADLIELIGYLGIRDQLVHPLIVVGEAAGGDAALLAAGQEPRIDAVLAVDPYLTSDRWLDTRMAEHDMFWIPFPHTLLKFWYELRSNYAPEYRTIETVSAPDCPALIVVASEALEDETLTAYRTLGEQVQVQPRPATDEELIATVQAFVKEYTPTATTGQEE